MWTMSKMHPSTHMCSAVFAAILAVAGCNSKQATENTSAPAPNSVATANSSSQSDQTPQALTTTQSITLPQGTPLHIQVDQTLSSATNHAGDEFDASISAAVQLEGRIAIPRGARVYGKVIEATPSGRLEHPGLLRVALHSVEINGQRYDLETSSVSREGANHNKNNAEFIGGGAGAGALIGALVGHGKGAAIGAGVGAAAGTAGAATTGKHDVTVPAETVLTFRLTQPLSISVKS